MPIAFMPHWLARLPGATSDVTLDQRLPSAFCSVEGRFIRRSASISVLDGL